MHKRKRSTESRQDSKEKSVVARDVAAKGSTTSDKRKKNSKLPEVIDLDSEEELEPNRRGEKRPANGESTAAKKKRIEESHGTTAGNRRTRRSTSSDIKSSEGNHALPRPLPPVELEEDEETQKFCSAMNGRANMDTESCEYGTPAADALPFRRPTAPALKATGKNNVIIARKSKRKEPSERQVFSTEQSRLVRKAIIHVIQDHLEDVSKGNEDQLKQLLSNLQSCIGNMSNIFATKRYPCGDSDDLSHTDEIEEFARWWLFGITALFFSSPTEFIKRSKDDIKYILHHLCQFLHNGHPTVVDRIVPQLLRVLRDLTVRDGFKLPVVKIKVALSQDGGQAEQFAYEINITEENEWAIPHCLQALSILFPRIFHFNAKLGQVLLELLHRMLEPCSAKSVDTVLPVFTCCLMPASAYISEDVTVRLLQRILEMPVSRNTDELQFLFNQYEVLRNSGYSGFLPGSGLALLRTNLRDLIYSKEFSLLYKSDKCERYTGAFRPLVENVGGQLSVSGIVACTRLVSVGGLDVILNPLFEKLILEELVPGKDWKTATTVNEVASLQGPQHVVIINVRETSKLWCAIMKEYELLVSKISPQMELTQLMDKLNDLLEYVEKINMMLKLIIGLREKLIDVPNIEYQFLELEHLHSWCNLVFKGLLLINSFQSVEFSRMILNVLETLQYFDQCNWFRKKLGSKFFHHMLCIPGWPWVRRFKEFLPQRFNALPTFAETDSSRIKQSKMLISQSLRTLRLKTFQPWHNFVVKVYSEQMTEPICEYVTAELLNGIADVGWPFKIMSLQTVFLFIGKIVKSNLWKTDSYLRSCLGKAIVALPCICCYFLLESKPDPTQPPSKLTGNFCVCCSSKESCDVEERKKLKILSETLSSKILALAVPLLKSKFLLVKKKLSQLIVRCHNHSSVPSACMVIPFTQVAVFGKVSLCEEVFQNIGALLADVNINKGCPFRSEIASRFFTAIPELIASATVDGTVSLSISSKVLKGFLRLASYPLSLDVFVELIKCLVLILAQCNKSELTQICQSIIAKSSTAQNSKPNELMSRVRREVSQEVIKVAIDTFYASGAGSGQGTRLKKCADFLASIFLLGEYRYRKMFTNYYYSTMMEQIVPNLHEEEEYSYSCRFLLMAMAANSGDLELGLLQEWLVNYYPVLLLDYPSSVAKKSLAFLDKHYGIDASFAATQQEQRILNEFLGRMGERQDKVLRCLPHICSDAVGNRKELSAALAKTPGRTDIQLLLDKRLLGFFLHLDTKLHSRFESVDTKRKLLESFIALIKWMGKANIVPLRAKVYKTLNAVTEGGSEYYDLLFESWQEFARQLDNTSLGWMTSQILAALLPMRNDSTMCESVDRLISHFVCTKKEITTEHYLELYFLLDKCDNKDVVAAIGSVVNRVKSTNWKEYFNMLVKESSHENFRLRSFAFKKLRDVLKYDFDSVDKIILSKGHQHASRVISALLAGFRGDSSQDEQLRLIIVDCFGCLGALDPIRFWNCDDIYSKNRLGISVNGDITVFAVHYLQELIREFQEATDTTNFDYCACLIQQVLKEFNVVANSADSIWANLSETYRELVSPLLSTKYQIDENQPTYAAGTPVYLSEHGYTFDSWLLNWLTVLISYIKEEEKHAYSLFNKNKFLLQKTPRVAAFIIPHVTMYAIFCATAEQRQRIVLEIKTVLERWTVLDAMRVKAQSTAPVKDSQTEYGLGELPRVENEEVYHFRCTQVIFAVLDHLDRCYKFATRRWGLKKAHDTSKYNGKNGPVAVPMSENNMKAIRSVLEEIPYSLISQVSFDCESYTSALYYLEQELRMNSSNAKLQENLGYLQRIYVSLNDMDSVVGISAIRQVEPPLCEVVLENIGKGKIEDSVRNLEKMKTLEESDLIGHYALVQAYLNLDEPGKAKDLMECTIWRRPEWEIAFRDVQLESLVKLKEWSKLRKEVEQIESTFPNPVLEEKCLQWNIAIARTMSKIESRTFDRAVDIIQQLKSKLVAPFVAASGEPHAYKRSYLQIVQLHILVEVEDAIKLLRKHAKIMENGRGPSTQGVLFQDVKRMLHHWDSRLENVMQTRKVVEQILVVRRSVFEIMKTMFQSSPPVCELLNSSIRQSWLDIAHGASKCGNFVRADNCLFQAKTFMSPKVFIEEAKILVRKGEKENAISVLQKGVDRFFPQRDEWRRQNSGSSFSTVGLNKVPADENQILCSKALLLIAKLSEELKLLDMEEYIAKYKEAAAVHKDSEKNFFTLASYHDRLWSASEDKEYRYDIQATVVRYYALSLLYGCKYVYQSLPRLLSIWFDFAASLHKGDYKYMSFASTSTHSNSSDSSSNGKPINPDKALEIMNNAIRKMIGGIPVYILLTAFSQLVSRLCHSHPSTWQLLKEILVSIICEYPYQTLWMTMAVTKSVNDTRKKRCLDIFKAVEKKKPNLKSTIRDYSLISDKLIQVCEKVIDKSISKASLKQVCKALPTLLNSPEFGNVAIPFQVHLHPSLPHIGSRYREHDAFPETLAYIDGIEDEIDVMPSLIRPKKIVLKAHNGKRYGLMCKPKDDLRKDSKVMEVNNVVNWYLRQNPESSQRSLHVRTYAVVPLNEECGLLEWVPNLQGLRPILLSLYKEKNLALVRDARTVILQADSLETKRRKFTEGYLQRSPPVFREWFFNNFNDHQSWYAARMAYIRTAAVMSIVGFIMGLGDRHGENILLDSVTGEVVHVDFNCLFNKGETFEWIERVPFRLTQNMVDAMGPLGYEGVFRRSCEIVMNMFREHRSIFLSVLRPFVFDPLVEWGKDGRRGGAIAAPTAETGEITNGKAVETMKYIRNRLNGTARNLKKDTNTELSVEAYVKYLIEEATSLDNLCQMYFGWAAYM